MTDERKRELNETAAKAKGWYRLVNSEDGQEVYVDSRQNIQVKVSDWNPTEDPAQAMEMLDWLVEYCKERTVGLEIFYDAVSDWWVIKIRSKIDWHKGETLYLAIAEAVDAQYGRMQDEG